MSEEDAFRVTGAPTQSPTLLLGALRIDILPDTNYEEISVTVTQIMNLPYLVWSRFMIITTKHYF